MDGDDPPRCQQLDPWIVSNVIDVLLLLEWDAHRRSEGIARGMRILDSYLAVLPPDGGCDEGAGHFNMAGAALADALQSVYAATGGRVSFYHEPLIRRIAAFPLHAHIGGPYFINFADCDAMPRMDGELLLHTSASSPDSFPKSRPYSRFRQPVLALCLRAFL